MLEAKNIYFSLNGNNILNGVNLSLEKGKIFGLIGPNGAGKTTLLNVLSGFLSPTTGETIWNGQNILENSPHITFSKGIVRTWQEGRIFKNLTVMDNLLCMEKSPGENLLNYLFKYRKIKAYEQIRLRKAQEIIRHLNLESKENNLGKELSYGQQKLLSIGRMLMLNDLENGHKCILMDEPFTGVHEDMTNEISRIVKKIADHGNTVLMVEHNLEATFALADIVLVMNEGRIVKIARPKDIKDCDLTEIYEGL